MIQFKCSNCGQEISVEDQHGGKKCRCRKCSSILNIPSPDLVEAIAIESDRMPTAFRMASDVEGKRPRLGKEAKVVAGAVGAVVIALAIIVLWQTLFATSWEMDNQTQLRDMCLATIVSLQQGKLEDGIRRYDSLRSFLGKHKIEDADLCVLLAETEQEVVPAKDTMARRRRNADVVGQLEAATAKAQAAFDAGDLQEAEGSWTEALALIPEVDASLGFPENAEQSIADNRERAEVGILAVKVTRLRQEAENEEKTGDQKAAVEHYGQAIAAISSSAHAGALDATRDELQVKKIAVEAAIKQAQEEEESRARIAAIKAKLEEAKRKEEQIPREMEAAAGRWMQGWADDDYSWKASSTANFRNHVNEVLSVARGQADLGLLDSGLFERHLPPTRIHRWEAQRWELYEDRRSGMVVFLVHYDVKGTPMRKSVQTMMELVDGKWLVDATTQ